MRVLLAISDADARALISVFGALLAAFGFFYTGVRDVVREGTIKDPKTTNDAAATEAARQSARGAVKTAFWPAIVILAVSSCTVVVLMGDPIIDTLSSLDTEKTYSPSKAAFVALGVFWLVLAGFWLFQAFRAAYRLKTWPKVGA